MLKLLSLFLLVLCGVVSQPPNPPPTPSRSYHFREVLTNETSRFFEVRWRFIGDRIFLAIVCNTNPGGYCGIGWSQVGAMLGSDAVIGSISPSPAIEDYVLNQKVPPGNGTCPNAVCPESSFGANCTNNVRNVTGANVNGYLVLEFSRPINASDPCDRAIEDGAIIWAAGSGAVPNGVNEHSFRDFITIATPFVWFRPTPTTGVPTTAVPTTGSVTTAGTTTAVPGVDTNDSPTTAQATTGASTVPAATTGNDVVSAGSSSSSGFAGLSLWLAILILVIVICAICIIVAVGVGCFVRRRKSSHEQHGNFY